ncbi:MAG: hypothetical protein GKR77_06385 [Legionellales bacterium]|nr:hypothetical protein [Legionellales bacterium]
MIQAYWSGLLILGLSLLGCIQSSPSLPATTLETRAQQTRQFNNISETTLLTATIAVLQDLGYTIEESNKPLGIVTAAKRATVGNAGEKFALLALGVAAGVHTSVEHQQLIRVTVVTQATPARAHTHQIRATFQHEVWDTDGKRTRAEPIHRDSVYQDFFAKLSQAVFLEQTLA